jgi:hypothetical protein
MADLTFPHYAAINCDNSPGTGIQECMREVGARSDSHSVK